jgi:hypothetical protein
VSFHPQIMQEIVALGHEAGYHYEDVSCAARKIKNEELRMKNEEKYKEMLLERAIESFERNLARMR